jgi:hypothetical protein
MWSDVLNTRQKEIVDQVRSGGLPLAYTFSSAALGQLIETMDIADEMVPFTGKAGDAYGIPRWMRESGLFTTKEVEMFFRFGTDILGI